MDTSPRTARPVSRPFRVAFLGGNDRSAIGRTHRIAIEMDRQFQLVAGCFSRRAEVNQASAEAYGVPQERTYASLAQLLAAERSALDAIAILTPTDQHHDEVLACLDAGLPVICEKALAASSADAERIQQRLRERQGFLAVTYNYSGYPMVRELKALIAAGILGRLRQIQIEMPQESFSTVDASGQPRAPQNWRLRDGTIPTVSLDLGTHLHSLVNFVTGEQPLRLVAHSTSLGNFPQVVDSVSCIVEYSAEIECNFWFSKAALGQRNGLRLRVFGELGSAEWAQEQPELLVTADNRGNRQLRDRASEHIDQANLPRYTRFKAGHPAGFIEAFANYYHDVAVALDDHLNRKCCSTPYVFGIEESLEGLRLFEAVALSSQEKRWVDVQGAKR